MSSILNPLGRQFAAALDAAVTRAKLADAALETSEKVHVSGAGGTLTFAYEQLRNAAEYTEEHLLLQRAVHRFYKRVFLSRDKVRIGSTGDELIIELTLAGYLENDTVAVSTVKHINELASEYFTAHETFNKDAWALDVLAVEIEKLLSSDVRRDVFTQFAYDYFLQVIDQERLFGQARQEYELGLFVAVHRALLKSDPATIRAALLHRYQQTPSTPAYAQTNEMIDGILDSGTTDKVYRIVNRHGAPLRILWRLIDENEDLSRLLGSREQFLVAYEKQIVNEYARIDKRINKGIIKSVIFLIITKFVIGVSIEVPYDYWAHGAILWLPLAVNLLFPPVYMVLLRFTLSLPGAANTRALTDTVDNLLYGENQAVTFSYRSSRGFGLAFNIAYATLFIAIFGGAAFGLINIGFSFLHLLIFFVFLSTASFLGFRLSRQIRELEVVEGQQDGVTMVRDFLYIPFVVVGRWMSEKYSKVNIVAMVLDMLIELPLKTVLHLIRQWGKFITSKQDEL